MKAKTKRLLTYLAENWKTSVTGAVMLALNILMLCGVTIPDATQAQVLTVTNSAGAFLLLVAQDWNRGK